MSLNFLSNNDIQFIYKKGFFVLMGVFAKNTGGYRLNSLQICNRMVLIVFSSDLWEMIKCKRPLITAKNLRYLLKIKMGDILRPYCCSLKWVTTLILFFIVKVNDPFRTIWMHYSNIVYLDYKNSVKKFTPTFSEHSL